MKCPYCGEDMKLGVIQSPQEINWKPKKAIIGAAKFNKDAIILSEFSIFGSCVTAFNCDSCKKIIIDYRATT